MKTNAKEIKIYHFYNIILEYLKDKIEEIHRSEITDFAIKKLIEKFNINIEDASSIKHFNYINQEHSPKDQITKYLSFKCGFAVSHLKNIRFLEVGKRGFYKISQDGISNFPIEDEKKFERYISANWTSSKNELEEDQLSLELSKPKTSSKILKNNKDANNLDKNFDEDKELGWKDKLLEIIRELKPE